MLAACCHTSVLSGWYEPREKSQGSQAPDAGQEICAKCAGKRSAGEGRGGQRRLPKAAGGGGPHAARPLR